MPCRFQCFINIGSDVARPFIYLIMHARRPATTHLSRPQAQRTSRVASPVESVDPFTGVITTGYGTPPGGGRAYRATIYVTDPALDARSLNLALQTRAGPVSAETARAIEDAILTRARQLRAQDKRL